MSKRKRQNYTNEFKEEAVELITEQGYSVAEVGRNLGVNANMLGRWKRDSNRRWDLKCKQNSNGSGRRISS